MQLWRSAAEPARVETDRLLTAFCLTDAALHGERVAEWRRAKLEAEQELASAKYREDAARRQAEAARLEAARQARFAAARATANDRVWEAYLEIIAKRPDYVLALHRLKIASTKVDDFGDKSDHAWHGHLARFITQKILPACSLTDEELGAFRVFLVLSSVESDLTARWNTMLRPADADSSSNAKGREFEEVCASSLKSAGYVVSNIGSAGDQGADLLVHGDWGHLVVVQCKNVATPVGNSAVQEVYAARGHYRASVALVVSASSTFTPAARSLASSLSVVLTGPDQLVGSLRAACVSKS